jgi:lipopolysaccharide biosynthesis regulator YciM
MNFKTDILKKVLFLILSILLLRIYNTQISFAYSIESINKLNPATFKSVQETEKAVLLIAQNQKEALAINEMSFDFQKLILSKSGECISALVAVQTRSSDNHAYNKQKEKEIFLNLRKILKQILTSNEKIVSDLQENTLDTLNDPASFIKSSKWQQPQFLISLSSYWIGWNDYHASMLYEDDNPMFATLLNEAIKGFSRAFLDFEEDDVIARSLLGRALCYGKLKIYGKAGQDLKLVKKMIGKNDPLYIRCLYEEIRIAYETGNYEIAARSIDEFKEDFAKDKIPEQINKALDTINFRILFALEEKKEKAQTLAGETNSKIFEKLKHMASNPTGVDELYKYAKMHAPEIEGLSYENMGPVASMALGDMMFEKKDYNRALKYYLPIFKDSPSYMSHRIDGVWFHTATIYCKKEQYGDALFYLKQFHEKYPASVFLSQSVPLYYAAAINYYSKEKSQESYNLYIDALEVYIEKCPGNCTEMSEAHFRMGKHYQKTGNNKKAADMFSMVKPDSPNYPSACYYAIQYYIDELDLLAKKGQQNSHEAKKIYKKGTELLAEYKKAEDKAKNSDYFNTIKLHMIILQSSLSLYGTETDIKSNLKKLKEFEKRFSRDNSLYLNALLLKMKMYQHLGMIEAGQKDLNNFSAKDFLDTDAYSMLSNLAQNFYNEGQTQEEIKTGTVNSLDFALIVYGALYKISCKKLEYQKYCDIAKLGMARIYNDKNQLDKAEAMYQDMIIKGSMSADAVYNLGLLYEKREQWEEALKIWRKFSDGVKSGTYHWFESRYKTAYALAKLGDNSKACEILNITMVLHPDLGSTELKEKYLRLKAVTCKEKPAS